MNPTTESQPIAPPTVPSHTPREVELLLTYVRDRDVQCPRCEYNLRNLTQPVCPECREHLVLKVGTRRHRVHWLLLTIAPGMFAAIAVAIFMIMSTVHGFPPMPWEGVMTMTFLTLSGTTSIILAFNATWFLRRSDATQVTWTGITWGIHLLAFAIFVANT